MSDFVFYRLPGTNEIVRLYGTFKAQKNSAEAEGFVVTDFLHQDIWVLEEAESQETKLHFRKDAPEVISPRDYQLEAQAMLNAFGICGVEKAVYSRIKAAGFDGEKSRKLFEKLEKAYPNAFVYLISSEIFGTWIGATPEVLIDVNEQLLKTVALAGTHPKGDDSEWTLKEYDEHEYVAEAVESALTRHNCEIIERNGPFVNEAGPVKHLKTTFLANIEPGNEWKLAMDLHPTPAVCGTPRMAALELLESREMHKRELYTGVIGFHQKGETKLFVNLRCAQIQRDKAFLYVGGGYTKDSIPDLEWQETENKARTLLDFMDF